MCRNEEINDYPKLGGVTSMSLYIYSELVPNSIETKGSKEEVVNANRTSYCLQT